MRSTKPGLRLMCGVAVAVFVGLPAWGGEGDGIVLTRVSINGGGAASSGGDMELSVTIGQPDADTMKGGGFEASAGFWFPVPPTDCGADGDVDLLDFAAFSLCLSGPEAGSAPDACRCYDVDRLGTVDLRDFAAAQNAFTGP